MRYIYILLSLSMLFACQTDASLDPKTKTEILLSTTWQIQEITASGYLNGTVYQRGRTAEGSQYDMSKIRLTFYANGTCLAIDNTGNNTASGKWKLINNDSQLQISETNYFVLDGIGEINSLLKTEFVFSGTRNYKSAYVNASVKMVPAP
ncbi:hypothetical protein [Aquirufa regiilacus]|uniref:Lipocalin-like domain-containing protein n=1 Tax=Aquirufa regiilacus TaxID=3024868 RepID=A0ABU3TPT0_9BACT|nr:MULTISPECIES: hypothetical protein [unclassified Aquirufa]MDT8887453.1 hypothetical protein [Aquirufa sp. LEPPI-3A]MDU0807874.1 hypothetical protein [Aquirufa sp. LEOWEIH-7C]